MNKIEECLSCYQAFDESLQKEENLLLVSDCQSVTSAFGMNILQRTKSTSLFQGEDFFLKCISTSPFYSFKKTLIQKEGRVRIRINEKEEEYSFAEYLTAHDSLPNQARDSKRRLLPVLLSKDSIQSSERKEDDLIFELNRKGTFDYQKEILIDGDFDSVDIQSCEVNINLKKKEVLLHSRYKIKNGFFNLAIEEKNIICFSSKKNKIGFNDFESYFRRETDEIENKRKQTDRT